MDPITFSIIRHRLFRVVEEAVITLKHVSGSAITNEGHDLMVSLYQADGSLLMGGVGFLHHLTSAAEACKAIIRRFGGQITDGDVTADILANDQISHAVDYKPLVVGYNNGAAVHLSDVAHVDFEFRRFVRARVVDDRLQTHGVVGGPGARSCDRELANADRAHDETLSGRLQRPFRIAGEHGALARDYLNARDAA